MIDAKELYIGAHYYNTSYATPPIGRITRLDTKSSDPNAWTVTLEYDIPKEEDSDPYEGCMVSDLDPIPLTAALLTEIGFVCRPRELAKDRVKNFFIDEESAKITEETRLCFPQIELGDYGEIGEPKLWRVRVLPTTYGFPTEAEITVRYLHELEQFVYLTIKKELIEE